MTHCNRKVKEKFRKVILTELERAIFALRPLGAYLGTLCEMSICDWLTLLFFVFFSGKLRVSFDDDTSSSLMSVD